MMKNIIISLVLLFLIKISEGQCTFNELFPVKHGISRYDALLTISGKKNLVTNEEFTWMRYANNDSTLKTDAHYKYINWCIENNNNYFDLFFSNDKLTSMRILIIFSKDQFEKFSMSYDSIVLLFKENFATHEQKIFSNNQTKEQTGEGYWFFLDKNNKEFPSLTIEKTIQSGRVYNESKKQWQDTNSIGEFWIEIIYSD